MKSQLIRETHPTSCQWQRFPSLHLALLGVDCQGRRGGIDDAKEDLESIKKACDIREAFELPSKLHSAMREPNQEADTAGEARGHPAKCTDQLQSTSRRLCLVHDLIQTNFLPRSD